MTSSVPHDLKQRFEKEGYVAPIKVMEEGEAQAIVDRLNDHIDRIGPLTKGQRNNPHLLFTWADRLVRDTRITDHIAALYGEDLLVWGSTLFVKPANDPGFVSWHQDSTYWGLDPADVVTAWVALSDSHEDNGAVGIVPGSHLKEQMPHRDTVNADNMLSRGQEIAVDVAPEDVHLMELNPGEMSLHHVRMIHGSGPNRSDRPRIGFAIRYLPTSERQLSTVRDTATLARGADAFGHFDPEFSPKSDFDAEAVAFHKEVEDRVNAIIMA